MTVDIDHEYNVTCGIPEKIMGSTRSHTEFDDEYFKFVAPCFSTDAGEPTPMEIFTAYAAHLSRLSSESDLTDLTSFGFCAIEYAKHFKITKAASANMALLKGMHDDDDGNMMFTLYGKYVDQNLSHMWSLAWENDGRLEVGEEVVLNSLDLIKYLAILGISQAAFQLRDIKRKAEEQDRRLRETLHTNIAEQRAMIEKILKDQEMMLQKIEAMNMTLRRR